MSHTTTRCYTTTELKEAFGHFSTGVVVVTGQSADGPAGFTCQSFVALSLEPALVSFAPSRTSTTWPALRPSGAVCLNILADEQEVLCRRFSRRECDRFADVEWAPGGNGAPALGGVLARIEADVLSEVGAGDHTIVLAQPTAMWFDSTRAPLIYYRGRLGCPHPPGEPSSRSPESPVTTAEE